MVCDEVKLSKLLYLLLTVLRWQRNTDNGRLNVTVGIQLSKNVDSTF